MQVLIALVLGIILGNVFPGSAVRVFTTFNAIFSQYIGFLVPLIIVGLVTPAIANLGNGAGKMLIATVGLAYLSTVLAGLFSYGVSSSFFPSFIEVGALGIENGAQNDVEPFFSVTIPPLMGVMTALVLAFILGILIPVTGSSTMGKLADEMKEIVTTAISKTMIPLLPIYIFGIFLKITYTGEAMPVLKVFAEVIVIIFAMTFIWLVILFCISGAVTGKNPLKSLVSMLPAYATALGTSSSAATIPVTLQQATKAGAEPDVAAFTVPLCATIHMPGSVIKITACAVTLMIAQGIAFDPATMIGFVLLLSITLVAAPGVPGGCIMASVGILSSVLGFGEADIALMIALYIVMDSFGTAANVTGDGAIAQMISRLKK